MESWDENQTQSWGVTGDLLAGESAWKVLVSTERNSVWVWTKGSHPCAESGKCSVERRLEDDQAGNPWALKYCSSLWSSDRPFSHCFLGNTSSPFSAVSQLPAPAFCGPHQVAISPLLSYPPTGYFCPSLHTFFKPQHSKTCFFFMAY